MGLLGLSLTHCRPHPHQNNCQLELFKPIEKDELSCFPLLTLNPPELENIDITFKIYLLERLISSYSKRRHYFIILPKEALFCYFP